MALSSKWKRPGWHALGPLLTLVGVALLVLSPVGYRLGWFGVPVALLRLIPLGVGACALGLVFSLVAIVLTPAGAGSGARMLPALAAVVCLAASVVPVTGIWKARHVPRIHDITTDTELPPAFVALAPARIAAPNGLDYGGAEVAAAQRQAYPDVKSLYSRLPFDALFDRAQQAAGECGWQLADVSCGEGRIEGVVTSMLYGFKDDIVVRVRSDVNGSRLDVRSASRVGRSDLGVNADRIRKYLQRVTGPG